MINIVKEIKIELLKGIKFLMRVYKRDAVFSFSLAVFIVLTFSSYYFQKVSGIRYTALECSAIMVLTYTILYIFDFVNAVKNFFIRKAQEKNTTIKCTRVSVCGKE